jgi:hypothetical protein
VRLHTLICSASRTSHRSRSQRITSAGTALRVYILHRGTSGCIDHHSLINWSCSIVPTPSFCDLSNFFLSPSAYILSNIQKLLFCF